MLHIGDAAHDHLVLGEPQEFAEGHTRVGSLFAHGDERTDQRDRSGVEGIDGLQFVRTEQRAFGADVLEEGPDLHIAEQLQFGKLLGGGAVQVERITEAVGQHLEERGEVHVAFVPEPLGGRLDALLDQVARYEPVLLRVRPDHGAKEHPGQRTAHHSKR